MILNFCTKTTSSKTLTTLTTFSNFSSKKANENFIKISKLKIDQTIKGYQIYKINKGRQFRNISIGIAVALAFSFYTFAQSRTLLDLIPLTFIGLAAVVYQARVRKTVRSLIVDKTGEALLVQTYGFLGSQFFRIKSRVAIHELRGITHEKGSKRIALQGGGYKVKPFKLYFNQEGIIDKEVFDGVAGGKFVKYTDTF